MSAEHVRTFVHPADRDRVWSRQEECAADGSLGGCQEFRVLCRNGSVRWLRAYASPVMHRGQAAVQTACVDITLQKQGEEILRFSNKCLEIASRWSVRDALLEEFAAEIQRFSDCEGVSLRLMDETGNVSYQTHRGFDRRFCRSENPVSIRPDECICTRIITGRTNERPPARTEHGSFHVNGAGQMSAVMSEKDKDPACNACRQVNCESIALIPIRSGEDLLGFIHIVDSRKNKIPAHIVQTLEGVTALLGVSIRRILAEEALRKREQLLRSLCENSLNAVLLTVPHGTLAEMAAEMAHELNQPLSAIIAYGGACLRQAQSPTPDMNRLVKNQRRVLEQARRAREVMRCIQTFVRHCKPRTARVSLGKAVRDAVGLVQGRLRRKNIALTLRLKDKNAVVRVNLVQIEQALVNILRNAIEAVEEAVENAGSTPSVTVETRVSETEQAQVIISDTGPGIVQENMPRLFEPFFTTKPTGLGVGLSISRKIVEMHGGTLEANRNSDGMTFTMTLPLA